MTSDHDETQHDNLRTPEEVYDIFWKEQVEDSDGNLDMQAVKEVLYSFAAMLNNNQYLYTYLTDGEITDPFSDAGEVMRAADEFTANTADEITQSLVQQINDTAAQIEDPENRLKYIESTFEAVLTKD